MYVSLCVCVSGDIVGDSVLSFITLRLLYDYKKTKIHIGLETSLF
jgi:hypothetical protein